MESKTELTCETCRTKFARLDCEIKNSAKRGRERVFCSRPCRHKADIKVITIDLAAEYLSGKSMMEVGRMAGISERLVSIRLTELHIPRRAATAHLSTLKNPMIGRVISAETRAKMSATTSKRFECPEARAHASHMQTKAIAEGKFAVVSKLEDKVAIGLDELGIKYERQVGVRHPDTGRFGACVDFMLADGRALEVNGTYWHSDPRVYPNGPEKYSQKNSNTKYQKKKTLLAGLRIEMLEIWEIDIKTGLMSAIKAALQ